jgi:glycosyltransferase involved in cell wall biosynthesis
VSIKISSPESKKKRFIVAGQVPPPIGGQAVMIARILDELRHYAPFEVIHLPFFFTKDLTETRRPALSKVIEALGVICRLGWIRIAGPISAVLYPVGGPQFVPLLRDICLLPWILFATNKVIMHFHAGGIAETINDYPSFFRAVIRFLYRRSYAAIVMTEFGKRDAVSVGIRRIEVVPHTLDDAYDAEMIRRNARRAPKLLYLGHFSHEKGTPSLLEAVAALRASGTNCSLQLESSIRRLELEDAVGCFGMLTGKEKWVQFATADLFVFPSVAHESFGLVMVEAMMWGLPIVACDWRGNREVLGEPYGGILFQPKPNLATSLTAALREALTLRESWSEWGSHNRQTFVKRYKAGVSPSRLVEVFEQMV